MYKIIVSTLLLDPETITNGDRAQAKYLLFSTLCEDVMLYGSPGRNLLLRFSMFCTPEENAYLSIASCIDRFQAVHNFSQLRGAYREVDRMARYRKPGNEDVAFNAYYDRERIGIFCRLVQILAENNFERTDLLLMAYKSKILDPQDIGFYDLPPKFMLNNNFKNAIYILMKKEIKDYMQRYMHYTQPGKIEPCHEWLLTCPIGVSAQIAELQPVTSRLPVVFDYRSLNIYGVGTHAEMVTRCDLQAKIFVNARRVKP